MQRHSCEDFAAQGQDRQQRANGWFRKSGARWKARRNDQACARFFDSREAAEAWCDQ